MSEGVQGLAGKGEEGFSERLALRRVRVDERREVFGVRLPSDRELPLGDEFADTVADADAEVVADSADFAQSDPEPDASELYTDILL